MPATVGESPMNYGPKYNLYCRPANRTRFRCHRPRVDDRKAMDAIFYRLRTGCQWKALDATGICPVAVHIDVFRNGPEQASSDSYGHKASWTMMNLKVSIGNGKRWMER
jgi:hypothetical protein